MIAFASEERTSRRRSRRLRRRSLRLTPSPHSPRAARLLVAEVLAEQPPAVQRRALLVVSELVSNAVLHAGSDLELRLEVDEEVLRVEVEDRSPQLPRPRPEAPVGGKGLVVVAALAEWGVRPAGAGKTVWARVPLSLSAR